MRRAWVVFATVLMAIGLTPFVGRDFFPHVDAGIIQLHVRAPARTRIEETEKVFQAVENEIRATIPQNERDLIIDDIGLPQRPINLAFTDGSAIGVNDGCVTTVARRRKPRPARFRVKVPNCLQIGSNRSGMPRSAPSPESDRLRTLRDRSGLERLP